MFTYYGISKRRFIAMRNYIREQPNEFMRILLHIKERSDKDFNDSSFARNISKIKNISADLLEQSQIEWKNEQVTNTIKELNKKLYRLTEEIHDESNDFHLKSWNMAKILANPNVDAAFFEENKKYLNEAELHKIQEENMNLWRAEDLPDEIEWPITPETKYDDGNAYNLDDLYKGIFETNTIGAGEYELNSNITIDFIKKIIEQSDEYDFCDLKRVASNWQLSANEIINFETAVDGDELLEGLILNPNLTLKGFEKTHTYEFDCLFDDLWQNKFMWNYDTCWGSWQDDIEARFCEVGGGMAEFLPTGVIIAIGRYIDYK
jgi:hypothetical protein